MHFKMIWTDLLREYYNCLGLAYLSYLTIDYNIEYLLQLLYFNEAMSIL